MQPAKQQPVAAMHSQVHDTQSNLRSSKHYQDDTSLVQNRTPQPEVGPNYQSEESIFLHQLQQMQQLTRIQQLEDTNNSLQKKKQQLK